MKSSKITFRVLFATFASIYGAIFGYSLLLPQIFLFTPAETADFWHRMIIVINVVGALAIYLVYLFYRPVAVALKQLETEGQMDEKTFHRSQNAFKQIEYFLFAVGIVAYNLGVLANMLPDLLSSEPLNTTYWAFRFVLAVSFGLVNGVFTARVVNIALLKAKERMGVTHFGEKIHKQSTLLKLGVPIFLLILAVVVFSLVAVLYYATMIRTGKIDFQFDFALRHFIIFSITLGIEAVLILLLVLMENQSHIKHVLQQVIRLSEGSMDLSNRMYVISYDDMGHLSSAINLMLDNLRDSFANIKGQTKKVSAISDNLSISMKRTAEAIDVIMNRIEAVKDQALNQSGSVEETNAAVEQIASNIGELNKHIEQQSVSVTESSSAIEQMLASISSVTQTLVNNSENIANLTKASEEGRYDLETVSTDIQQVAKDSESLLEISTVIQDIASQTNLLSMNAAIEAAHAGDAGKGFAVVAEEIRKLAENSGQEAQKVAEVLITIKESVDKITNSIGHVTARFEQIDAEVKTVASQEGLIRNAMEEQTAGSREVFDSLSHLNDLTQKVREGSGDMITGSKKVLSEGANLTKLSQDIASSTDEMAKSAEMITTSVAEVDQLSVQNGNSISSLLKELEKFILDE